jgi:hypothetical protein
MSDRFALADLLLIDATERLDDSTGGIVGFTLVAIAGGAHDQLGLHADQASRSTIARPSLQLSCGVTPRLDRTLG